MTDIIEIPTANVFDHDELEGVSTGDCENDRQSKMET